MSASALTADQLLPGGRPVHAAAALLHLRVDEVLELVHLRLGREVHREVEVVLRRVLREVPHTSAREKLGKEQVWNNWDTSL